MIKINILYSLSYQIPVLYFNVWDFGREGWMRGEDIGRMFGKLGDGGRLGVGNVETGIYVAQNPLTKEYMYTLHSC
jgi:hypothetical protein